MDDLIEMLRRLAEWPDEADPVTIGAIAGEAAAALEAAREDVERLDFLDSRRGDDVHPEPGSGDPVLVAHYWYVEGQCHDVRTAIDAAREARNG